MDELKGKPSKHSSKQKEAITSALSSTPVRNHNLPIEEVFLMAAGKPLLPEKGFEPVYTNIRQGGESYHMLDDTGIPYFFFVSEPEDVTILPDCETDVELKWIATDLLEIRFVFFRQDGSRYLGGPFIFFLKNDDTGGMTHRWELKQLLDLAVFEIMLVAFNDDGLLHYIGSAPVRLYEYKKDKIYNALAKYLAPDIQLCH